MTGFILVANSGKKISLEHASHPCPKCKNQSSVQLTRSEKSLIVLNKRITDNSTVRYECSQCKWKNQMLPYDDNTSVSTVLGGTLPASTATTATSASSTIINGSSGRESISADYSSHSSSIAIDDEYHFLMNGANSSHHAYHSYYHASIPSTSSASTTLQSRSPLL